MKNLIILTVFLHLCVIAQSNAHIEDLASHLVKKLENRGIEHVAIWKFDHLTETEHLIAEELTEEFSMAFLNASSTLKIYERESLDHVISELKLQNSGMVNEETSEKIGEFTGAEAIISGKFSLENQRIKLWIKVIESKSAYQIAGLSGEIPFKKRDYGKANLRKHTATGMLELKNRRNKSIEVTITQGDTEKIVVVGPKAEIEIYGLKTGVHTCKARYTNSTKTFEAFDALIKKNRKTKYKFRYIGLLYGI